MQRILVRGNNRQLVVMPPADVPAALSSKVQTVKLKSGYAQVWPWTSDSARILTTMGHRPPSPVLRDYHWPGKDKPFASQKITAGLIIDNFRSYVLSSMGVGKTRAALFAADFLIKSKRIRRVLVAAPLSTLDDVWAREIREVFPWLSYNVLHGTKAKRLRLHRAGAHIDIINHDGLKTLQKELVKTRYGLVIIDELAVFRNTRTQLWKAADAIVHTAKHATGMTGTPMPNDPTDVFGQVKLLTPSRVPNYYRQWQGQTMIQVSNFLWKPRKGSTEAAFNAMKPAVRYTREECIDLPGELIQTHRAAMTPKQEKAYNLLKKYCYAKIDGEEVVAQNDGVLMFKLLQASTGFVYTQKNTLDLGSEPRQKVCLDLIADAASKVIVFVPFIALTQSVSKFIEAAGYSTACVSGAVSRKERARIFDEFKTRKDPHVLVAHPKCMAHGLTLTSANVVIWYTAYPSLEIYEQANARITRAGQKHTALICHIQSTEVERRIFKQLQLRQSTQGVLLDMHAEDTKR